MQDALSRRRFLLSSATGISAAWVATHWPAVLAAADHAHAAARSAAPPKFEFLSPEQAAEVEAMAAQIIPSDDTPGAREAGVIHFIDRALVTFDKDSQKVYLEGLPKLQETLLKMDPAAKRFSAASAEQQIAALKAIEKSTFFRAVRTHTVLGFLSDPERGGNANRVGWKLIGFEDSFNYEPPFGYYDRDYPGWEASMKTGSKE